jgi:glutathione peroxidase-family protein
LKKDKSDYLETFINDNFPDKIDSSNIPSEKDNSICIMTGQQGQNQVFIVDQNNNKDFSDDSIRAFRKMDWQLKPEPIKCYYNIYNGKEIVQDSGWINLGTDRNNELSFFVAHNMVADFSLDHVDYKVQFVNGLPFARFCFENPILAIVEQNGVKKDSLLKSERIEIGEYLKLGKNYYRFDDVSNDGKILTLVKEKDVSSKIGTQPGFIAPDFNCQSIEGDSIRLTDYKGKYLLIANITSCWSEIMSYEYYNELTKKYESKIKIVGIDNSPVMLQQNIKNLNLKGQFVIAENNSSIQSNYREDYCSRTCFLINPEGRIVDRFEIGDWKAILEKHFN